MLTARDVLALIAERSKISHMSKTQVEAKFRNTGVLAARSKR